MPSPPVLHANTAPSRRLSIETPKRQDPTAAPVNSPTATGIDEDRFPEPWRTVIGKIPGTARVIVTYRELGSDLTANPSPQRRSFLASMIFRLSWPKGAIGFWPFTLTPDRESPGEDERKLFQSGLSMIAPDALFFFGQSFQMETGLQVQTPDTRPMLDGVLLFKLPPLTGNNLSHPAFLDSIVTRMTALYSPY